MNVITAAQTAKDQRAPWQGLHLLRPTVEIASDKKIVDYTKLKEVSSETNAKFKGKCCVKKERQVSRCVNWYCFFLHSVQKLSSNI